MNNEDIKILESMIEQYKNAIESAKGTKNIRDIPFKDVWEKEVIAIENLIKRNKELEEMLKNRIKYTNELEKDLFENASNYVIPKSKVREKIEALDDIESEYSKKILNISKETATFTIFVQEILKELLQEGDK